MTEMSLSAKSAFLSLPTELILHILSLVDPLDLARASQTCRQLARYSFDDQLWQPLINESLPHPIRDPAPAKSFRELFVAHHPRWFLPKNRIWFADTEPSGKLLVSRYDPTTGSIVAYAVTASRGRSSLAFWEKDTDVVIHDFDPRVALDLHQPVLRLDMDSPKTDDLANHHPSDRAYAPSSSYSKETLMETFSEAGLFASFMLCRSLPSVAVSEGTKVWPPLRFAAESRTRNETRDGYSSAGHRPSTFKEVSQSTFRLRKWVEFSGRRSSPRVMSLMSANTLSAALGIAGPYFAQGLRSTLSDGMSIRMPEDITTYATLPLSCYTSTKEKPWQGIWCGDYSGHGCEFLVIVQPDKGKEKPLPDGMDWLLPWFRGGVRAYYPTREEWLGDLPPYEGGGAISSDASETDLNDVPTGRLEAIKLTGDPNIPRAEYTFIAPEIGHGGFMRVADEAIFKGARVVRSAGHIAGRGFRQDQYTPTQLIMISHDRLAQFWEGFGHISYYQRVDVNALLRCGMCQD